MDFKMKIVFTNVEVESTKEYWFWRRITNNLTMESPSGRSDLVEQYLYDQYELTMEEFNDNRDRSLRLRSVKCPEITEKFLRLKYASML